MAKLGGPGIAGSIQAVRRSLGNTSGNRGKMLFIKPDSAARVRFLQEPEEFFIYDEHFDKTASAAIPALDPDPLADSDNPDLARVSRRQLVNVLNVESGDVQLLKMNQELAGRALVRYQKYKTLTDRDYEITRTGASFDTSYDMVPEAPESIDLPRFRNKMHDPALYLLQEADRYYGSDHAAQYLEEKNGKPATKKSALEDDDDSTVATDYESQQHEKAALEAEKAALAEKKAAAKKPIARKAPKKTTEEMDEKWGDIPWEDDADPFPDPLAAAATSHSFHSDDAFDAAEKVNDSAVAVVDSDAVISPGSDEDQPAVDPWAKAREEGRPCRQAANGLCEICGFDIEDCLSA